MTPEELSKLVLDAADRDMKAAVAAFADPGAFAFHWNTGRGLSYRATKFYSDGSHHEVFQ